ncbi:hypothetical protein [Tidjanibacter massiliensis]|uniref:hypothetical protein n=1 Tax=Tidjanibacter massiliensis TaxID=1871003 RepID=UPI00137AA28D|nr:hypothetical protein [Tidjanibacter massiliensis]
MRAKKHIGKITPNTRFRLIIVIHLCPSIYWFPWGHGRIERSKKRNLIGLTEIELLVKLFVDRFDHCTRRNYPRIILDVVHRAVFPYLNPQREYWVLFPEKAESV